MAFGLCALTTYISVQWTSYQTTSFIFVSTEQMPFELPQTGAIANVCIRNNIIIFFELYLVIVEWETEIE